MEVVKEDNIINKGKSLQQRKNRVLHCNDQRFSSTPRKYSDKATEAVTCYMTEKDNCCSPQSRIRHFMCTSSIRVQAVTLFVKIKLTLVKDFSCNAFQAVRSWRTSAPQAACHLNEETMANHDLKTSAVCPTWQKHP